MKNSTVKLFLGFYSLLSAGFAYASPLYSGVYEGLLLAVSSSGNITGYYSESAEDSVQRTCTFFLSGNVSGKAEMAITSWSSPQSILPGKIRGNTDGVTLTIPEGQNHAGCISVILPDINSGLDLEMTKQTHWQSLVQAINPRVYLNSTPNQDTQRKAWVVKGDVAGVLQTESGWTQIQYVNSDGKATSGWVQDSDILPITPPAR